jgi:simple sugar transport system substrate-binding protein
VSAHADAQQAQARDAVAAEFGARIHVQAVDTVVDEAQAEEALRALVAEGHGLIFGQGVATEEGVAAMAAAIRRVAADAPAARFEQLGGHKTMHNLRVFEARTYESAYLVGLIAGTLSQTHTLGVIVPTVQPTLEAMRTINAFTLGAQTAAPQIKTRVVGSAQAEQELGAEVDMVLRSTEARMQLERVGRTAEPLAIFAVDWTSYYRQAIQSVLDQKWVSASLWWGLREEAVALVSMSPRVPVPLRQRVEAAQADLKLGKPLIWKGPILGQDGKAVLRRDEVATDKFLYGMNFYVKGVEGQPQGF